MPRERRRGLCGLVILLLALVLLPPLAPEVGRDRWDPERLRARERGAHPPPLPPAGR